MLVGSVQATNAYAYVENRTTRMWDPNGESAEGVGLTELHTAVRHVQRTLAPFRNPQTAFLLNRAYLADDLPDGVWGEFRGLEGGLAISYAVPSAFLEQVVRHEAGHAWFASDSFVLSLGWRNGDNHLVEALVEEMLINLVISPEIPISAESLTSL